MKLPILIEVNPVHFNESPLVFLESGEWTISHNLIDSEVVLSLGLEEFHVSIITKQNKIVGPCTIRIKKAKIGSEKSISIYAQKCL